MGITAPDHERGREGHAKDHLECEAEGEVTLCHRSSGSGPGERWPGSWGATLLGDFEFMVTVPLFESPSLFKELSDHFYPHIVYFTCLSVLAEF